MKKISKYVVFICIVSAATFSLLQLEDPQVQSDWHVAFYDKKRASPGYNLVKYEWVPRASLIALDGSLVYTWEDTRKAEKNWYDVTLATDGGLLTITPDEKLSSLDKHSKVLWEVNNRFHHAVEYTKDEKIVTLRRFYKTVSYKDQEFSILNDSIAIFDTSGKRIREIDLFDVAKDLVPEQRWQQAIAYFKNEDTSKLDIDSPIDFLHTNSVRKIEAVSFLPEKPAGFLVSFHSINTIAIIAEDGSRVLWSFGPGILDGQHDPSMLESGNILVLDNGVTRKKSRVVEIDPRTKEIIWSYDMNIRGQHIFVKSRGGAQRLPNGNTLITASHHAIVFEVSPSGELIHMYKPVQFNTMERFLKRNKPPNYYRVRRFSLEDPRLGFLAQ